MIFCVGSFFWDLRTHLRLLYPCLKLQLLSLCFLRQICSMLIELTLHQEIFLYENNQTQKTIKSRFSWSFTFITFSSVQLVQQIILVPCFFFACARKQTQRRATQSDYGNSNPTFWSENANHITMENSVRFYSSSLQPQLINAERFISIHLVFKR